MNSGVGVRTKLGAPSGDEDGLARDVGVSHDETGLLLLTGLTGVENSVVRNSVETSGGGHDSGRVVGVSASLGWSNMTGETVLPCFS